MQVGEPPLQDNGLPSHFTLGASASLTAKSLSHKEKAQQKGETMASNAQSAPPPSSHEKDSEGGEEEGGQTAAACGRGSQQLSQRLIEGDLPPPDRMHVTLFFRSL